ncbi:hypothetical protein [Puerhibacterium sp. TATVAM-FAB25]|uniref:hypothetical protein n=1 Tax=Puerhibacterium sp. TATVAM-FAB25 TaxID=3093699 RepID=UPI00397DE4CE
MSTTAVGPAEDRASAVYRYVRLIALLPAVWLLLAIFVVWAVRHEVLESISDYYGGPLRDVFVGGLMAAGICMVAYKGDSKLEDYALNFAGANTFFVALVPNSFPQLLATARAAEAAGLEQAVSSAELLQNLRIAVGTFVLLAAVFVVMDMTLMRWTRFRLSEQTTLANVLIGISWLAEILLVVVVVAMVLGREVLLDRSIFDLVHFAAAGLLVLNLSFAAASHAFPGRLRTAADRPADTRAGRRFFLGITVAMWIGLVVGGLCIWRDVPYAVFWTEVWELALFLVFWIGATRREWRPARA